jgi:hypothetical protein
MLSSRMSQILREKHNMIEDKNQQWKVRVLLLAVALSCHPTEGFAQVAGTKGNSAVEGVAVLKQLLQESLDRLRAYEWTETTVVRLKGDEKARRLSRCHYRIDGKIQRDVVSIAAPQKRKEELADYIERAITLVRKYVPPDLAEIQRIQNLGRASMHVIEPEKRVSVEFHDYWLKGDKLNVEVDLSSNRLNGLNVSSFLGETRDPVTLEVRFGVLSEGSSYPAEALLEAKAKKLNVTVTNSEHRKLEN